jgi:hypothetical protein
LRSLQRNGRRAALKLDGNRCRNAAVVLVIEPRSSSCRPIPLFAYKRGGRLLLNYSWASLPVEPDRWAPRRTARLQAAGLPKIPDGGYAGGRSDGNCGGAIATRHQRTTWRCVARRGRRTLELSMARGART